MTKINANTPLGDFAQRLRRLDSKFTKPQVEKLLPYWWDEELNNSPGAVQEAIFYMAKYLSLDLEGVLDESKPLHFRDVNCRYRKADNRTTAQLQPASAIIHSLARMTAQMVTQPYQPFDAPAQIRATFLQAGHHYVDFIPLVRYCWEHGVPVLFVPKLPLKFTKMQAVVVRVEGRYVICLTKNHQHASYLLFDLAHEMGHIYHQHLQDDGLLLDEEVNAEDSDTEESEANRFANILLTGEVTQRFRFAGRTTQNHAQMINEAHRQSLAYNVEPGHILLNWAYWKDKREGTFFIKLVNVLLKKIYPNPTWRDELKEIFLENSDASEVKADDYYYLRSTLQFDDATD